MTDNTNERPWLDGMMVEVPLDGWGRLLMAMGRREANIGRAGGAVNSTIKTAAIIGWCMHHGVTRG